MDSIWRSARSTRGLAMSRASEQGLKALVRAALAVDESSTSSCPTTLCRVLGRLPGIPDEVARHRRCGTRTDDFGVRAVAR